jgi:CheY-like chemotaxis protein
MGKNILVIEDDPLARLTLRAILEEGGYSVRCATNGREGLKSFAASRPDIVVTDIVMPEMDGIETIRALRSAWPDGAIIAISEGDPISRFNYLEMARHLGANAVLAKPFAPGDLIAKVEHCADTPTESFTRPMT